jgi:enoyl-CoA hydratase
MLLVKAELAPETARRLVLASETAAPDAPLLAGVVDRVVDAAALRDAALEEARALAAQRGFTAVKQQLRGEVIARMRRVVEEDDEPLLAGWVQRPA